MRTLLRRRRTVGLVLIAVITASGSLASGACAAGLDVFAWGYNNDGQLGNGTTTQSDVPVRVEGLNGVTSVAAGEGHALAVLEGETVMAWGRNEFGELGNGTHEGSEVPIPVPGLEHVSAVAAGAKFSLALRSDGTVMAWGANTNGQLGDGSTESSDVPVPVSGLSGVTAISARSGHSLALLSDGTVMAWGENANGQLGDGSTESSDVPVPVSGLSDVIAVSAGATHSLALVSGGAVMAWGGNDWGELGDGGDEASDTPVPAIGLETGALSIAAGEAFSLALRTNGTALAWGRNTFGQLGDGDYGEDARRDVPEEVQYLEEPATSLSAGADTSFALLGSRPVAAWGGDEHGELGIGKEGKGSRSLYPQELPALCGATEIAASYLYALAAAQPQAPCPVVTGLSPEKGREVGGTTVDITGSQLEGATAVDFGTEPAESFTVNSPDSITAVSPPGTKAVYVTVSVPGGTSAPTEKSQFVYREPPRPSVTAISPKKGPAAGGTQVSIKGSGFEEITSVTVGGAPASEISVHSSTLLTADTPAGKVGKVSVAVTNPTGTSAPYKKARFTYKKNKK